MLGNKKYNRLKERIEEYFDMQNAIVKSELFYAGKRRYSPEPVRESEINQKKDALENDLKILDNIRIDIKKMCLKIEGRDLDALVLKKVREAMECMQ